jgi:hypothetical protein
MIDIILVIDSRLKQNTFESLTEEKLERIDFILNTCSHRNYTPTLESGTHTGGSHP